MALDISGPVIGNRRHNLVMHDQYMKKYEEMQKTFSHRSLQLQREERELDKKLEAIVGKNDSSTLTKTIRLEPLLPRETSSRKTARARTPFPRDPATNFLIPSPPKGRPKTTVRGRRLSRSNEIYETKSEGRASPLRQPSPERGQPSVTGEDAEKRKRMAALSRRRNTVCSGVLKVQLEQLSNQRNALLRDTDSEEPEEQELEADQEDEDKGKGITEQLDSEKEVKGDESDNFNVAEESVSITAIEKPKNLSAIFCYKYEEENVEEEKKSQSVLTNSKPTSTECGNTRPSNRSAPSDNVNVHQNFSKLQENGNSKVCRKIAIMSPVPESDDGVEEESRKNDNGAKEASAEQCDKISSSESASSNNLTFHQNHFKSQQSGNSKFSRKIAVMSPVLESEWTEETSNDTNDNNEKCICEVQSVNKILPDGVAVSRSEPSQTISLAFSVTTKPSLDKSESPPKGRIDSETKEWPKARPTSSLMQRGRSPARRLSRSLESSASPPAANPRLMHRRRSLDPNMLADMKQFQNVQRKPERQVPMNSLRRRSSVCDPSFQGIDMVGVDVGREKFKSIARRMLALSRGHQKDESDDVDNKDDASPEWKDIEKCRYLRTYVPKWDRG